VRHEMMLLVCHAADGHFADGDREAVRRVLNQSECLVDARELGSEWYQLICVDGGQLALRAPGLNGNRAFHRIEVLPQSGHWTADMLDVTYELMVAGGFGLVNNLDRPQFMVTEPQQITYFPWLPEPPLLVRSARDLGYSLGQFPL